MAAKRFQCALLVFCLLLSLVGCGAQDPVGFCVEILDVGQSDCTLITADGSTLMIDAGTSAARHAVQGYLSERRIKHVDYLLLTHPHEDHVGNARMLIETDTVGALILPPTAEDLLDWQLILNAAAEKEIPVYTAAAGDVYSVGGATLEILQVWVEAENVNDQSVICRATYGSVSCLFTADAEKEGEARLLANVSVDRLDCDLLKAGHHGSETSSCEALLLATTPTYAAVSCGINNEYGFPHKALTERLVAAQIEYHRTDTDGTLTYKSDGESLWLEKG